MSKGIYDIFSLVINILGVDQQLKHIAIGFFESSDTFGHALAKDLIDLLGKYDLRKKVIAYVKIEGSNLSTMTTTLKFIISSNILSALAESYQGSCFGHAFFKAYQYALAYEKVYKGPKHVCVKTAQFDLQKCIIWLKKVMKGRNNGTMFVQI